MYRSMTTDLMELEGSYCGDEVDVGMTCFCGEPAPLCTSKTNPNPGRRFFGCSNYMNEERCTFFCWYDPPPNMKNKRVLRPMKIRKVREVGRGTEQVESSSTPLKKDEAIHSEGIAIQMRIDAMQMEIEKLKAANEVKYPAQESQNMGTSKWKVLFFGFLGWLLYYMYTSLGKSNHLALP